MHTPTEIKDLALQALEDLKAQDIKILDVTHNTDITDFMIISSGTSTRHVKAIAGNVSMKAKEQGVMPLGMEGEETAEWVLVDLGDVVVHVMIPSIRDFYQLERLWDRVDSEPREATVMAG